MEPATDTNVSETAATELAALPPIADLASREIRRMGRAWKIEATKSILHIVMTIMVMTVLGVGWLIFFSTVAAIGWTIWSKYAIKATIKPYKTLQRSNRDGEVEPERGADEQYIEWLVER